MSKFAGRTSDRIIRVALYGRVSTEEQAIRGFSIDAQVAALYQYTH